MYLCVRGLAHRCGTFGSAHTGGNQILLRWASWAWSPPLSQGWGYVGTPFSFPWPRVRVEHRAVPLARWHRRTWGTRGARRWRRRCGPTGPSSPWSSGTTASQTPGASHSPPPSGRMPPLSGEEGGGKEGWGATGHTCPGFPASPPVGAQSSCAHGDPLFNLLPLRDLPTDPPPRPREVGRVGEPLRGPRGGGPHRPPRAPPLPRPAAAQSVPH